MRVGIAIDAPNIDPKKHEMELVVMSTVNPSYGYREDTEPKAQALALVPETARRGPWPTTHRVGFVVTWLALVACGIVIFSDFFEVLGGDARPIYAMSFVAMITAPLVASSRVPVIPIFISTAFFLTVSIVGPTPFNVVGSTNFGACFRSSDWSAKLCQKHAEGWVALHPILRMRNFSRLEVAETLDFAWNALKIAKDKGMKVDIDFFANVCDALLLACDPSCVPHRCGKNFSVVPEFFDSRDILERVAVYLSQRQIEFVNSTIDVLNDWHKHLENFSYPCQFIRDRETDVCVGDGEKLSESKDDYRVVRIAAEVATFALLILVAPLTTHVPLRIPDKVRVGGILVNIFITGVIFVAATRLDGNAYDKENRPKTLMTVVFLVVYTEVMNFCGSFACQQGLFASKEEEEESLMMQRLFRRLPWYAKEVYRVVVAAFHPKSIYYILYLFTMEVIEVCVQVTSLISSAHRKDVALVVVHAVLISTNVALMPLLIWISTHYTTSLLYILIAEILFDKGYIVLSIMGEAAPQGIEHVGLLMPVVMTAFTVQVFREAHKRETPIRVRGLRCIVVLGGCVGAALASYTCITYVVQANACHAEVGDVVECMRPRYYWSAGFFGPMSCGYPNVSEITCAGIVHIPETDAYRAMQGLKRINISGPDVKTVPWQWSLTKATSIDISRTRVCDIPWILQPRLEKLLIPACSISANWSGRGIRSLEHLQLGSALQNLERIDLSHNMLTVIPRFTHAVTKLSWMDVRHNQIQNFRSDPRIEYPLVGNPIREALLNHDPPRMMARWRELREMQIESLTLYKSFGEPLSITLHAQCSRLYIFLVSASRTFPFH